MSAPTDPPQLEEKPWPGWQKATAVGYIVVVAVCVWAFRGRLGADFWPFDNARVSPNILATLVQIAAYTPVAVLVWPPTRRRIHLWMMSHTAPLHAHFDRLHAQRESHHAEQMRKLEEIRAHLEEDRARRAR